MRKRIRNSLAAKVFLLIASLLILCSLLIYGIIMIILPKSYTAVVSTKVIDEMVQLTETLAQTANSHFLRTAGPHFPDSPGHIKRTAWDISRAEGTPPH